MDIKNSKMTKIKLLGITMVMFLTGCSSMSVEQCHTAQWFSVGEVDGSSGHVSRIDILRPVMLGFNLINNFISKAINAV